MKSERAVLAGTVAILTALSLVMLMVDHPNPVFSLVQELLFISLVSFIIITFAAAALQGYGESPAGNAGTRVEQPQHPSWFFSTWDE